jgi:SPP1 gp7 family putative phage head morphogenesis protein
MDETEPLPIGPPADAVAALTSKGYEIAFDWREVWQEENAKAFTVAKAMSRDLLEDIREAVQKALDEGQTLQQFQKELRPRLVARGWWGRALMTDPADGVEKLVRLGSPARLRTIYQVNLRVSYMAGRWSRLQRTKSAFPLLGYIAVDDARVRPEHSAWDDTILPVDHPWWDTHFPPNGWNCRCDVQPVNERMLARRGWKVTEDSDIPRAPIRDYVNRRTGEITRLEQGLDPGWSYNVGKAALDGLTPPPRIGRGPDDGITSELNAQISNAAYERMRAFFEAFNLTTREAAVKGRVFTDVAGWPLAISAGLLRRDDGEIVRLTAAQAGELPDAARTIIDPDRIGWLWIAGRDGRAMLVRRYQGAFGSVDFGRSFWRWMGPRGGAIARGMLVWTREDGAVATPR